MDQPRRVPAVGQHLERRPRVARGAWRAHSTSARCGSTTQLHPVAHPEVALAGRGASGFGAARGLAGLMEMVQPKVISETPPRSARRHYAPSAGATEIFRATVETGFARGILRRGLAAMVLLRAVARHARTRGEAERMPRAVVIGGGLAGLSAAVSLAARGHAVSLVEGQPALGGKARAVQGAGVLVDVGPTVLTDLAPLARLFAEAGVALEDAVSLGRVDPALLATFPGGRQLAMHADPAQLAGQLEALGPEARADWRRLLDLGARAARLVEHYYARGDVGGARDLMQVRARRGRGPGRPPAVRAAGLPRIAAGRHVRTGELRRLLAHFARFVGLDAAGHRP